MATTFKDHSLASHSGAVEDSCQSGLVACKSVQFENCDGTPGLRCTSASGEENWTVTAKNLSDNDFATAIEATRGVTYRQRHGVPGLEMRRGCSRSSVSWIPVVPSPVACRTRTRTKLEVFEEYLPCAEYSHDMHRAEADPKLCSVVSSPAV